MMIGLNHGPWLNAFDLAVESFFSSLAGRCPAFDKIVVEINNNYLLRGGVIMLLAWYTLFQRSAVGQLRKGFELVLGATLLGAVGTVLARMMAHFLPYRIRPFTLPYLHFPRTGWDTPLWGCFPSDHAVLFFAIATGIFFVSRRVGLLALAWVVFTICLPRLYLGMHWPTDMLVETAMGIGSGFFAKLPAFRQFVERTSVRWHREHPEIFFTVLFLWSLEIATIFEDVRHIFGLAFNLFKS